MAGARIQFSFRATAAALLPTLRAFGDQLEVIGRAVEEVTEKAYEDAGRPFGRSREGKLRWLEERALAERLRAEADEIESWHRALAILREKREVAERREREAGE